MSFLAATESKLTGILRYGDTDPSILLQNPLTSESVITGEADATGSVTGVEAVFDSILGMKPNGSGSGAKFVNMGSVGNLDNAGQMSIEIEAKFLADDDTSVAGSDGYDHTVNDFFWSWSNASGTAPTNWGRSYISTGELPTHQWEKADTAVLSRMTNLGGNRFKLLTLSWIGSKLEVYVDGALISSGTRSIVANLFNYLYIGSKLGDATSTTDIPYYMRNLIVSDRPVMIPTHPSLAKVAFWGDSFVAFSTAQTSATTAYDHSPEFRIKGYLEPLGVGLNLTDHGYPGYAISDAHPNDLQGTRQAVLDDKPNMVVLQGGANDIIWISYNITNFETDYKDHIDTLLAAGTGIDKVIIGTATTVKAHSSYDSATYVARTVAVNAVINSLPAYWDEAHPSDTGRVVVYDLFTETGGESPVTNMFNGTYSGTDNLHLSSMGRRIFGELIGKTLYKCLFN